MQWVKPSTKKPETFSDAVIVKSLYSNAVQKYQNLGHFYGWGVGVDRDFQWDNTVWLDESEPSFTLQDVIDAFENGLYGEAVSVYIKATYRIDLNKKSDTYSK